MNGMMITMISVMIFVFTLGFGMGNLKDIRNSVVKTDSIYQDILSGTGTDYNSPDCGSGKIFKLNHIVYGVRGSYDNNVNVFIPKVDTASGIINYDQWYASKSATVSNCIYDLSLNNVKYQDIKSDGIYFGKNNNVLFLGKNTVKDDNSINY